MKKVILFAAILFSSVALVNAQAADPGAGSGSDTGTGETIGQVTLNVHLNPIQTITIGGTGEDGNPTQDVVDLKYTTDKDYKQGVKSNKFKDHITVVSTGKFAVKVRAEDLTTASGTRTITANTIALDAFAGNNFTGAVANKDVVLQNTDVVLAYSNTGATNKSFDVTYKGSGNDVYTDNYIFDETETVYTTTLTYSIEAE